MSVNVALSCRPSPRRVEVLHQAFNAPQLLIPIHAALTAGPTELF